MKLQSNNTGTFSKQDLASFDTSLWAATNGTINWSNYPLQIPYTENDVYHKQLTHTPGVSADIGWTVRIGKGGQIYYIDVDGLGQIVCPQRNMSPWNDDCMTTTVFSEDERNEDSEMGGNDSFANGYIHGSGMYIKPGMDPLNNKPFYNPILAEQYDSRDRSYSIVNWGLVPKPNINRGDVLFYSRYRDLGNGVIETTFYCYNFGDRVYNFAETPWFGFRPSKFPNLIKGAIGGTSKFELHNVEFVDKKRVEQYRGWAAGTVNPNDPNSLTCALVWGSNSTGLVVNSGFVNRGERDMMLLAPSYSALNLPYGTGFYYKRYVVLGKLAEVAQICEELNDSAVLSSIEFSTGYSGRIPIYQTTLNGQTIFTITPTGSPAGYTHPIPIRDSLPLMLLKNNDTGEYFISTDPYAACEKVPFTNPYPVGHEKHSTYENRVIYKPYDGKTEWVSLLGFAKQASSPGFIEPGYQLLSDILGNIPFIKGEKLDANSLMIPL